MLYLEPYSADLDPIKEASSTKIESILPRAEAKSREARSLPRVLGRAISLAVRCCSAPASRIIRGRVLKRTLWVMRYDSFTRRQATLS